MELKSGFKTSEAITALIGLVPGILAVLLAFGTINSGDVPTLQDAIVDGLTALGGLISSAMIIWKYIDSRTRVKEAYYSIPPAPPVEGAAIEPA